MIPKEDLVANIELDLCKSGDNRKKKTKKVEILNGIKVHFRNRIKHSI